MTISKLFINHSPSLNQFLINSLRVLGLSIVWVYRLLLSPIMGGQCRFTPSCSCYAEQALTTHTPWNALRLISKRLSQCRPGGQFGVDPVPSLKNVGHLL